RPRCPPSDAASWLMPSSRSPSLQMTNVWWSTTSGLKRARSQRSAMPMPTALAKPWPSGPVVTSTPGVWWTSGCPGVRDPNWRNCSMSSRMKRSRSGQSGAVASYFMILVNSTWARGARAMAVPGWPELAFWGASMARPRMTLMPSCSRSGVVMLAPYPAVRLPLSPLPVGEERHRRGEAVHEVAPAHRAELTRGEEARHRRAHPLVEHLGVVVGLAEQAPAPPVAGEQQAAACGAVAVEGHAQVLVGGAGVAHVELHGLAQLHLRAHGDGAHLLVGAQHVADQKVARLEAVLVLVDHLPQVQTLVDQAHVLLGHHAGAGHLQQPLQGGPAGQLVDDVALRLGDHVWVADGPA